MANGKIRFGKQSGGELSLVIPDGIDNTEVLFPESGDLATKEYIDNTTVKLTGNQIVDGIKTFSSTIAGNITGNAATASKLQTPININGVSFDGSSDITISNTTAVNLTGNQTIAGVKTFTSSPIVPTPTTDFQVATKEYVDSKGLGLNINPLSNKTTPVNTDNFVLQEVGGVLKKVSYENLIKFNLNNIAVKTALNATGDAPIYACRAWVDFNGTGTVAIRAGGNISSITDNGTGQYTVNFTTNMTDVNYSAVLGGVLTNGTTATLVNNRAIFNSFNLATTSLNVSCLSFSSGNLIFGDAAIVNVSIFR